MIIKLNIEMKKILLLFLFLGGFINLIRAQFNFHWAFPYYCVKNMSVENGANGFVVLTKVADFNGFPNVEHKEWGNKKIFIYKREASEIAYKSYIFVALDQTIGIKDIEMLHEKLPKSVIFFIHRSKKQWIADRNSIKKILTERPAWAYGGNPYNANTPIMRSQKVIFQRQNIILGNRAPGEGL